jgi:hypothetical protein
MPTNIRRLDSPPESSSASRFDALEEKPASPA